MSQTESRISNRILHSYINQFFIYQWEYYVESPLYTTRKFNDTIQLIYSNAKKKKIVLLVDEFLKLFDKEIKEEKYNYFDTKTQEVKDAKKVTAWRDELDRLLSIIHATKDHFFRHAEFNLFTCITSLVKLDNVTPTASNRAITWHSLPIFNGQNFLTNYFSDKNNPSILPEDEKKKAEIIGKIANITGNFPRGVDYCKCWLADEKNSCDEDDIVREVTKYCKSCLSGLYTPQFLSVKITLILSLIGIKIWQLKGETIFGDNIAYTVDWLMANGFIFSNVVGTTADMEISSTFISPIMLCAMLQTHK